MFQLLIHFANSGGREGVLVVWQLDTGKKKFLPRIGSPLLFFTDSPDPSISSVRKFSILEFWIDHIKGTLFILVFY